MRRPLPDEARAISAALIDAPDAGHARPSTAPLLYNDREGYMETFRPYARPGNDWLDDVRPPAQRPSSKSARASAS